MISIFIISHSEIANSFAYCLEHVLGKRVDNLVILPVKKTVEPDSILAKAQEIIKIKLEKYDGVIILTDIFGATPSNIACKLVKKGLVEAVSGLNLSMLLRAISYSSGSLEECVAKSVEGGINGIIHMGDS